jgi:hypothetical protein
MSNLLPRSAKVAAPIVLLATACVALPSIAHAQIAYDLSIAVRLGDVVGGQTLTSFDSGPSLNDAGILAFLAQSSSGSGANNGVFTQNNVIALRGSILGGLTLKTIPTGQNPVIANNGTVVFGAVYQGPASDPSIPTVFTQNGAAVVPGQSLSDGSVFTNVSNLAYGVRPDGTPIFSGTYVTPTTTAANGIANPNGVLVADVTNINGYNVNITSHWLAYGSNGTVGFYGSHQHNGQTDFGFFTQNGPQLVMFTTDLTGNQDTVIVDIFPGSHPTMNNAGKFAARVTYSTVSDTNYGIITPDGFVVQIETTVGGRRIFDLGDPSYFQSSPVINDAGTVAFMALSEVAGSPGVDQHNGIFTQYGMVAQISSAVDGTHISSILGQFSPAINNQGEIAFVAQFTNGDTGIVMARPQAAAAAPEPATLGLLALGIASMTPLVRRFRRRSA